MEAFLAADFDENTTGCDPVTAYVVKLATDRYPSISDATAVADINRLYQQIEIARGIEGNSSPLEVSDPMILTVILAQLQHTQDRLIIGDRFDRLRFFIYYSWIQQRRIDLLSAQRDVETHDLFQSMQRELVASFTNLTDIDPQRFVSCFVSSDHPAAHSGEVLKSVLFNNCIEQ